MLLLAPGGGSGSDPAFGYSHNTPGSKSPTATPTLAPGETRTPEPTVTPTPAATFVFAASGATVVASATFSTTSITTPNGGGVLVSTRSFRTQELPAGFRPVGNEINISAPAATAADPLRINFSLEVESLEGTLVPFRNGVAVPGCAVSGGATADPDPCYDPGSYVRTDLGGGKLRFDFTVLTSSASIWNFAVEEQAPTPTPVPPTATPVPPTATVAPTATPVPPTATPVPQPTVTPVPEDGGLSSGIIILIVVIAVVVVGGIAGFLVVRGRR